MKRTHLYRIMIMVLIIACCVAFPLLGHAQPDPPEDTPIDGGLSILLAAGAAYGVKKYRSSRSKESDSL